MGNGHTYLVGASDNDGTGKGGARSSGNEDHGKEILDRRHGGYSIKECGSKRVCRRVVVVV